MTRFRLAALVAALGLAIAGGAFIAGRAEAHERRTVAGKYTFVVGFLEEPALVGQPNGIDLRITNAQTNEPVDGVERTLKADIVVGDQTKTVELRPRFGQRGAYTANVIPTRAGTWVFRFYGDVEGTPVDERFESGPGRFNDVESPATIQFPVLPAGGEVATSSRSTPAEESDAQRALDEARSARRTGIVVGAVGIVVGAIGVALAAYALLSRRAGPPAGEPL